jgi:hypothetical protein
VSDFGLALHMGADATHVSSTHGGTVTHMAPELLLAARASKASDVYSVSQTPRARFVRPTFDHSLTTV